MIDKNELDSFIQKISKIKLTQDNYKEFFDYSIKVCKDYDIKSRQGTNDMNLMTNELAYIEIFYHKLCNMLYGIDTKFEFKKDGTNHYNSNTDSITYRFGAWNDLKSDSAYHIFTIFHENRHAIQFNDFLNNDNVLSMDPSAIVITKEILSMDNETYKNNHNSFMIENDANLYAYGFISNIIKQYFPENMPTIESRMKNEKYNIDTDLFNGFIDSEEKYKNVPDGTLPIMYQIYKDFKKNVTPDLINKYKILSLIYNSDGTLKKYTQIQEEKEKKIKELDNPNLQTKFSKSSHSYNSEELSTPKDRIELIYKTIINSDPALYIEDCICNKRYDELILEFNKYPNLFELYKSDFLKIIPRYMDINNKKDFDKISATIKSNELDSMIEKRYEYILKTEIKNLSGMIIDIEQDDDVLKDVATLNQEHKYLKELFKNKKDNKTISEEIYNSLIEFIDKKYLDFIAQVQMNNNNQNSIKQKSEDIIDNIPSEFHTAYNEYLKRMYMKYKGFDEEEYMSDEEKQEFEEQLDKYVADLMITGKYKEDKDRKELWDKIEPIIKSNPNVDLSDLIYQIMNEEIDVVEKPESVERTGRRIM